MFPLKWMACIGLATCFLLQFRFTIIHEISILHFSDVNPETSATSFVNGITVVCPAFAYAYLSLGASTTMRGQSKRMYGARRTNKSTTIPSKSGKRYHARLVPFAFDFISWLVGMPFRNP
ncbi:hypothetical protein P167DRAFT_60851 [Morchella conica CCBAS932]|uniref:Uncharacterized protein n=1 Tax=Morchella conica CCBAS932 TaxID=1392247 RepID=A0A3N4KBL3_9PEZI|nr:hypothetical protein P167DRAFT_60851 [Morchella conica CCBAS932]